MAGAAPRTEVRRLSRGARIARVAFSYQDVPVEIRTSIVNTERHEYWSEIQNVDR